MNWISIKDRLPEYDTAVFVLVNYKIYDYFGNAEPSKYAAIAELCNDREPCNTEDYWTVYDNPERMPLTRVSHWIEIPEYPEDNNVQVD